MFDRLIHATMAYLFFTTLLGASIWFFVRTVDDIQSASWPRTEGVVQDFVVYERGSGKSGPSYRVVMHYTFTLDGKIYRGDRYNNDFNLISRGDITDELIDQYRKGRSCSVAYRSIDPTQNYLLTDVNGRHWFRLILSGIGGVIATVAFVLESGRIGRKLLDEYRKIRLHHPLSTSVSE